MSQFKSICYIEKQKRTKQNKKPTETLLLLEKSLHREYTMTYLLAKIPGPSA